MGMEAEMNDSVMDEGGGATPVSPSAFPIPPELPEPRTLLEKAARESNFQLKLTNYEGPLDVLLRLIEEHQLEITEVSLAQVADQFVTYMTQMPQRDARTISNFISVAAKLILIKSRALLPATPTTLDEQEEVILRLAAGGVTRIESASGSRLAQLPVRTTDHRTAAGQDLAAG